MSSRAVAQAQLRLPLHGEAPLADKPFVKGAANADAVARLAAPERWPAGALALVGPPGSGKSHLAALWAAREGARAFDAIEPPDAPFDGPRLLEDADRALLDPQTGEALFHALNAAAQGRGGPLLLTGRPPPAEWPCALPDLRSRLNALPVAALSEPGDALLRALLTGFFRAKSVRPTDDLLDYLVRRIERSALGAAAIVEALDAACRDGGRLGRSLARELLDGGCETSDLFDAADHDPRAEG